MISDHHLGLKAAIAAVFVGSSWQRCRVHWMRNVLARVPKASAEMVAASIRTIFAQPDAAHVRPSSPRSPACSTGSSPTCRHARRHQRGPPRLHRLPRWLTGRKIWSTNPLERLNGEIKRRTNVVGIFPNDDSVLASYAVVVETHDEWQIGRITI